MTLDVVTLTFAGAIVAFACGLLLLAIWREDHKAWAAFWWALAGCGTAAGTLLLALHQVVSPYATDVVAPALLDVSASLTWLAAWTFNRGAVRPYPILAGVGAWIVLLVGTGGYGGHRVAIGFDGIIAACFYLATAFEFWRARREKLGGRWPLVSLLCLQALALVLRSAGLQFSPNSLLLPPVGWFGIIHFVSLVYAAGSAISLVTMIKGRSEAKHKAEALIDALTGLANYRSFMTKAQQIFTRNAYDETPTSLLAFDLDQFKRINDSYGHATGDHVLRSFAAVVSRILRPSDVVGRVGGEEFLAVLPGCSSQAAVAIAGRIRAVFQEDARFIDGQKIDATVSVGIATASGQSYDLAEIVAKADGALYRAKNLGRNRVTVADGEADEPAASTVIRIA